MQHLKCTHDYKSGPLEVCGETDSFADLPASDLCCLGKSNISDDLVFSNFPCYYRLRLHKSVAVSRNHSSSYIAFRKKPS